MEVICRGPEPYQFAVVCCLHGNERSGKVAINELTADFEGYKKGVKFIIANERAFEQEVRDIDDDLNRVFPGDPSADSHEKQLAAELLAEIQGLSVLDLHATVSYDEPVAFVNKLTPATKRLALTTGVSKVVDVETDETSDKYFAGSLIEQVEGVAVECGLRGHAETIQKTKTVVRTFLAANGVIPDEPELPERVSFFRLIERVDRPEYRFTATNFERVSEGEQYAETGDDVLVAEQDFFPVLMSTEGYDDILGYKARKLFEIVPNGSDLWG